MGVFQQHLLLQNLHHVPLLEAEVPSVHCLVVIECQHHSVPQACSEGAPWAPLPVLGWGAWPPLL